MSRKPTLETLPARVKRFIQAHNLACPGEKWLVGVSGGPDSACLLHLLCQINGEMGLSLFAAHLDHGLRGSEAEADAGYVADLTARLDVPLVSEKRDVLAFRKQRRCSLEEAAREVRYLFFHEKVRAQKASRVALAHTLDDQAETVLLHLLRGAGSRGLKGMGAGENWHSPVTGARVTVVRPLLEITRAETAAYCQQHDLSPRIDSSNRSTRFLRNRLRVELTPLLKTFNPRIAETLARTARIISQEQEALETLASPLLAKYLQSEDGGLALEVKALLAQPVGIQRYLLRASYSLLRGNTRDLESQHVEKMRGLLAGGAGREIFLPGGAVFRKDYGKAILSPVAEPAPPVAASSSNLLVPGETAALGYFFQVHLSLPDDVNLHQVNPYRACLDAGIAGKELLVRTRRPGDRFQPLGMAEEKKLQDFMVDAHIPQRLRRGIPMVCAPKHIIWVVGHRIDDRVKITESTREVLVIEAEPDRQTSDSDC